MNASTSFCVRFGGSTALLATLLSHGSAAAANADPYFSGAADEFLMEIVSVSASQQAPGAWEAVFRTDDCYDIRIPPHPVDDGAFLSIDIVGQQVDARVGFHPSGTIVLCEAPIFYTVQLGTLPAGNLELRLIGVDPNNGLAEYPFDSFGFAVSSPPRDIPAISPPMTASVAVLLGALAWLALERRAG